MAAVVILAMVVTVAGLFVALRYVEAYRRRKDLERRGRIKPLRREEDEKIP